MQQQVLEALVLETGDTAVGDHSYKSDPLILQDQLELVMLICIMLLKQIYKLTFFHTHASTDHK
jgi:hypothetical protein